MEAAEKTSQERPGTQAPAGPPPAPAPSMEGQPIRIEPDLDFIRALGLHGGEGFKKCIQCGTCSGTCTLSPDAQSFPCKEMSWAAWGMKDRLMRDPDVWLCYQCNDCSTRCPRCAKPGDVLGAVRRECVIHYAFPRFLARWVNQPLCIPLLLGIPIALLTLALAARDPVERALGISRPLSGEIVFHYSNIFPHWLLNSFFFFFSALVVLAFVVGGRRFWRSIEASAPVKGNSAPAKGPYPAIKAVVKSILTHDKFAKCEKSRSRFWSHSLVFFGFLGLGLVTFWVITARINPLVRGDFIYPFGFWNPWKMLANTGGIAVLAGLCLMIRDRLRKSEEAGAGGYFDWALLGVLLMVVLTGFFTEVLHYVRLEPHRHIAYFVHLVFVFALLMYLPYSKFAHIVYRTIAMVHAEITGRNGGARPAPAAGGKSAEEVKKDDMEKIAD